MPVAIERKNYTKKPSRERSIRIFLNDEPMAVSQGTPENLTELAIGFLLSEGLIRDRNKLRSVQTDVDSAQVYVASDEQTQGQHAILHRVTSAGCAQSALLSKKTHFTERDASGPIFQAEELCRIMEALCEASPRRNDGECVHGCGLGKNGMLLLVREDIGRHNAMDKLIGQAWLDRVPMHEMAMFTTGRISYEMALKANQSGVHVLVSHKSVTDSAVEFAEEIGLTLVGRCRNDSLQLLTCHDRVVG